MNFFDKIREEVIVKKYVLIGFALLMAFCLFGQDQVSYQAANNSSAYFYSGTISGSEQLKIYSYIWGQVHKPGLYIIPDDTDLLTLLSLAGGPTEDAKLSQIRIVRPSAEGEKVIFVDLEQYIDTADETLIPLMKPGDTVIVSGTLYYAFFRFADFVSKIAIVLSVVTMITNL